MNEVGSHTRDHLRQAYSDAWRKQVAGAPLTPLEAMIADVIGLHPEYQAMLQDTEAALDFEPNAAGAQENPFLHMGLHMAVREQVSIDRPPGVRELHCRLQARYGGLHGAEQNFDHDGGGDVVADVAGLAAFGEDFAKVALDDAAAALLDQLEQFRRRAAEIAGKERLHFVGVALHQVQELLEGGGKVAGGGDGDPGKIGGRVVKFVHEDGFDKLLLAGEMGVEGFFAHAQFFGEVVHGDMPEAVGEEMAARAGDDPMPGGGGGGGRCWRDVRLAFHSGFRRVNCGNYYSITSFHKVVKARLNAECKIIKDK